MNKIIKILNHNAIIVHAQESNEILLAMQKGIGFGRKISELVSLDSVNTLYHIHTSTQVKGDHLLNSIDPVYIEISHDILSHYQDRFAVLDEAKLLPLADHIAFAIQRMRNNITIQNPFSNEIRFLYPQEWEVAAKSREIIFNKLSVLINDDEIGYITLHLNSTQEISKDYGFMVAMILKETVDEVEKEFQIQVNRKSLSYSRLMMHMKYLIARLHEEETINLDMENYTKANIPQAYGVAERIVKRVVDALDTDVPRVEIGYLAMHMDRILKDSKKLSE